MKKIKVTFLVKRIDIRDGKETIHSMLEVRDTTIADAIQQLAKEIKPDQQ